MPGWEALNGGFERPSALVPQMPAGWSTTSFGNVRSDSTVARSGARSFALVNPSPQASEIAASEAQSEWFLPGDRLAGRRVRVSVAVRTSTRTVVPSIWLVAEPPFGVGAPLATTESGNTPAVTNDSSSVDEWRTIAATLRIPEGAARVRLGLRTRGTGQAWFDDVSIEQDGSSFTPWVPSPSQSARLHGAVSVLKVQGERGVGALTTRSHPSNDSIVLRLAARARIIGLGEATHGTHEFFTLRQQFTEVLVRSRGTRLIAVEAPMTAGRIVDEFVRTGQGDARAAVLALALLPGRTEEMLALVTWMRAHNASLPTHRAGTDRLVFGGIDLQGPLAPIDSVSAFVTRWDSSGIALARASRAIIDSAWRSLAGGSVDSGLVRRWQSSSSRLVAHLDENTARYRESGIDAEEIAWAVQYARLAYQGAGAILGGVFSRDSSMAQNAAWLLTRYGSAPEQMAAPAVLWAHNSHIGRLPGWLGGHLSRRFGREEQGYRPIAFTLGSGKYTAVGPRGFGVFDALPPVPGTIERLLEPIARARHAEVLALDLRSATTVAAMRWLSSSVYLRGIGARAEEVGFAPEPLAAYYDALVFVQTTRPTTLLTRPASR